MPDHREGNWLSGVFVPVTTNFDRVTGDVAPVTFRENLRYWLSTGLDGLVLFGSTGEGMLLEPEEKYRLLEYARDLAPAGVPLVAGVGLDSTRATIRQAGELARAGADALLVHPPAYYGQWLAPGALVDHFTAIADGSPVPVIIYHIPKYTKVTLEAGFIAELVRHPNIAGVKDSSGDLKRLADYSQVCRGECSLFVGNGTLLYTALELGAVGGIVAVGLLAPKLCVELLALFRAGRAAEAGRIQERLTPLHREIVAGAGVPGIKAALEMLGLGGGPPRSPLRPLSEKERAHVARTMQHAGLIEEGSPRT